MIWFLFLPAFGDMLLRFEDGKLSPLPEEFFPAEFDQETKMLMIAGKTLVFPDVILNLFPDDSEGVSEEVDDSQRVLLKSELRFLTSWGHGPSLTPPYLYIDIFPRGGDIMFRVWVDIAQVSIMKAEAILRPKDGKIRTAPIDISSTEEEGAPKDWRQIIGDWFASDTTIRISEDRIEAIRNGAVMDYPNGLIKPVQPGLMLLVKQDGETEKFMYETNGDVLELYFQRAPLVGVARVGSEADKMWRRLSIAEASIAE